MNCIKFVPAFLAPALLFAQSGSLAPSELLKPLKESWPTYNGDYSGRRFSALKEVNTSTVKNLSLAWMSHLTAGAGNTGGAFFRGRGGGGPAAPIIVGGEGTGEFAAGGGTVKASLLEVGGILYVTMPDNAWAVDARDGHELWHYFWKTKGGTHIGNRGVGMWNSYLYMETPDNYLVSLDAVGDETELANRFGHGAQPRPNRSASQASLTRSWNGPPPSWPFSGYSWISFGPPYAW